TTATATACATSAWASSMRFAPTARATAEETPPPIPPLDIMVMSIKTGNTRATPATAPVPRKLTNQVSAMPTKVWSASTTRSGHASPRSVGAIGLCSSALRSSFTGSSGRAEAARAALPTAQLTERHGVQHQRQRHREHGDHREGIGPDADIRPVERKQVNRTGGGERTEREGHREIEDPQEIPGGSGGPGSARAGMNVVRDRQSEQADQDIAGSRRKRKPARPLSPRPAHEDYPAEHAEHLQADEPGCGNRVERRGDVRRAQQQRQRDGERKDHREGNRRQGNRAREEGAGLRQLQNEQEPREQRH